MNYSLKSQNAWTHDQLQTQRTCSCSYFTAFNSIWREKNPGLFTREFWKILPCHDYSNILLCMSSINLLLLVMSGKTNTYSIWEKLAKGWVIGIVHWFMYFWKLKRGIFRLAASFVCFFNLTLQTRVGSNSFIYGKFLGSFLWCCKLRSWVCNVKTC